MWDSSFLIFHRSYGMPIVLEAELLEVHCHARFALQLHCSFDRAASGIGPSEDAFKISK